MTECSQAVPAGFEPLFSDSPFVQHAGNFHVRTDADGRKVVGCRIGHEHSNTEGYAHGGFLATFADFALSDSVMGITLNLTLDYMRPAQTGQWIEAVIVERKRSESLVFADAVIRSDGRDLVRISGVFRPFFKRL